MGAKQNGLHQLTKSFIFQNRYTNTHHLGYAAFLFDGAC